MDEQEQEREDTSMDRAIRPSQAMLAMRFSRSGARHRYRSPEEHAEVRRRVATYIRQVELLGRIAWLPTKGTGGSA
jgi:hypothetical protein